MSKRILRCKSYLNKISNCENSRQRNKLINNATVDQLQALLEVIEFSIENSYERLTSGDINFGSKARVQKTTSEFKQLLKKFDTQFSRILLYDTQEAIERAEANQVSP